MEHRRYRTGRRSRHGFTLVEIIVALSMLILGAYAMYGGFINLSRNEADRLASVRARWAAHQRLEELRAAPHAALAAWTPPATIQPVPGQPYFEQATVTPRADGALDLAITLGWNMQLGEGFVAGRSVTVTGVKAP